MPETNQQDFSALFYPLTDEIIMMTWALRKMQSSFENMMKTYQEFSDWLYEFSKQGVK